MATTTKWFSCTVCLKKYNFFYEFQFINKCLKQEQQSFIGTESDIVPQYFNVSIRKYYKKI